MLPHFYKIRLLTVLDQFGNNLESIQEGWKTICRFEFTNSIPNAVKSLPVLKALQYNKNSLKIANHEDLVIDANNLSKSAYATVYADLFSYVFHGNSINKKDFVNNMLKLYEENKEELNGKMPPDLFHEMEEKKQHTER